MWTNPVVPEQAGGRDGAVSTAGPLGHARTLMAQVGVLLDKFMAAGVDQTPLTPLMKVRRLEKERMIRDSYFPNHLTKDPVWPMLVELYRCRVEQQRLSVTSLSFSVGIPLATGHRWINGLCRTGYAELRPSATDRRSSLIAMTDMAHDRMTDYLTHIC